MSYTEAFLYFWDFYIVEDPPIYSDHLTSPKEAKLGYLEALRPVVHRRNFFRLNCLGSCLTSCVDMK